MSFDATSESHISMMSANLDYEIDMIYVFNLDETNKLEISDYIELLSNDRKRKMERYRLEKDRYLCFISFVLLRYGLYVEHGKMDMPTIDVSKKPRLIDLDVCFNISHCNSAVACVIDEGEVGIDIQDYNETVFDIRSMFLSKQEESILNCDVFSNGELTRIWTMKEAYGKFYGHGLCYSLCETSFDNITDSEFWQSYLSLKVFSKTYENYAMSICAEFELLIRFINLQDLIDFAKEVLKIDDSNE